MCILKYVYIYMLYIYICRYICTHKLTHRKFTSNKTSQEDTESGQMIVQSMSHSPKEGSLAREIPGEEKIQVVELSHRIPGTGILAYVHHKFQPCKIIKGYMYVQLSSVVYFDPTNEPSAESLDIQTAPEKVFIWTPKRHQQKTPTNSVSVFARMSRAGSFFAHASFGEAKTTNGSLSKASSSNEAQLAQLLLAAATGDGRVGATLWGSYPGGGWNVKSGWNRPFAPRTLFFQFNPTREA